ncbi:MAG: crotonase/enoyl-CoA hydratase family protein [Novosphingobium sp.]|nr:crotonase/enoyl-CoA hydratase family protein [Novosphingobium sp.]
MTLHFSSGERVALELDDAGVAHVRLARPDKRNALDSLMFDHLLEAGQALFETKGLRAVTLSGEGAAFCAGLDLSMFDVLSAPDAPHLAERTHGNANRYQQVAMQWRKLPVPVIAAVHGTCLGGGLQLAAGADIRIVAPDAQLSIKEMHWGLIPDMGGFALLRGLVRDDIFRELVYTARDFSGAEAQALGIATHVDTDPLARAKSLAAEIAALNPDAIRAAKLLANRMADADTETILLGESQLQDGILGSPNQREAVMSRMERRAPRFTDH